MGAAGLRPARPRLLLGVPHLVEDGLQLPVGAEIEWRRGEDIRGSVFVQQPQWKCLRDAIAETSEEKVEEARLTGLLTAADTKSRTFRMSFINSEIHGRFGDAIDPQHPVRVPARYTAHLRKTTTVQYSTEEESVTWF